MRFFQKKMVLLEILGDLQAGTTPSAAPVLTLPVSR